MIERITIDENTFCFERNGVEVNEFFCEREHLEGGKRGNWLLFRRTIAGLMEADRDQYSNDIMERLGIYLDDPERQTPRPITYGIRFKRACTKAEYLENWSTWCAELEFQFDGAWTADYHEWEGKAVLTKVLERPSINELVNS